MRRIRTLFLLIFLLQLPFLYSLCQSRAVSSYLQSLPREEMPVPFQDWRGAIHLHTALGGHSLATYPELFEAAKETGSRYLVMTEHSREDSPYRRMDDPDLVVVHGTENQGCLELGPGGPLIAAELSANYGSEVAGMEIYNIHENGSRRNSYFQWINFLFHRIAYRDLFFFHLWELTPERIETWDRTLQGRRIVGVAGNDAHQNVGIILQTASGQAVFSILVDPYLHSLGFVSNHLTAPQGLEPSEANVVRLIEEGALYVAFGRIADPTGFTFHAEMGDRNFPMGSTAPVGSRLVLQSPIPVKFRLLRDGVTIQELEGRRFLATAEAPGVYRLEAHLLEPPRLLRGKPWILANPIFVR